MTSLIYYIEKQNIYEEFSYKLC